MRFFNTSINLMTVLEYSQLFPEQENLDVEEILKHYNRLDLIRAVSVLSFKYQGALFPNVYRTHHFFSNPQSKYSQDIIQRWKTFSHGREVEPRLFVLPRTALELLRILLSISPNDFENQEDIKKLKR